MKENKKYQNRDWLYEKYWGEKLDTKEIAKLCDVHFNSLIYWMDKFNIKRRTKSERQLGKKNHNYGKQPSEKTKEKMRGKRPNISGEKSPNWKGGRRIDIDGYILIHKPNHPRANGRGYIPESHLVYEEYWNEHVPKGYLLHHMDENKKNNNIINIPLLTRSYHIKIHNQKRRNIND